MLVSYSNEPIIQEMFQEYLLKYGDKYLPEELQYIVANFERFLYDIGAPDILMEIYGELGLTHKIGDFYGEHLNRINRRFGLDKNILEIGSGYMPAFAHKVAAYQQKIEKGTITIYEPLLIVDEPKYPNMKLYKEEFTKETPIQDYDLLVGILPCEATTLILEQAIANDKDFYVAMCGCNHSTTRSMYRQPIDFYQQYVINKTKYLLNEKGTSELVVERLSEDYDIDYPILHNKRH